MPSLSSAGIGSGLDVVGLVNQLVAAERAPVANRLARMEASVNAEISAYGKLKSSLGELNDALEALSGEEALGARSVSVADEEVFTATASAGAAVGNYDIEVQQLAESHRLASGTPVNPVDSDVGYGQLDLTLGADSFSVTIDSGAATLADIRDAINSAADNPGITASIITVDGGAILQLGSDRSGTESEIGLAASGGDGGLDTLITDLTEQEGFLDAVISLNGQTASSSSNSFSDVIEGVTIDLAQARPGENVTLSVTRDDTPATDAIKAFVEAYNSYRDTSDQLGGFNAGSGEGGALNGDSLLRGINSQLRRALSASYGDGDVNALSQLGITTGSDGRLSLDEDALSDAIGSNFSAVNSFLNGDSGFVTALQGLSELFLDNDGSLESRLDGLNDRLGTIEDREQRLEDRLLQVEARYMKQFTALDTALAQMQQTSSFLGQQLASLPGVGG